MARQTFESWIPEEWGGPVITKMNELSAVERFARNEPMTTDTKHVPRSGGMDFGGAIAKGAAYPEDAATNDEVLLTARKLGRVVRIADEDIKDTAGLVDIIRTKQLDWIRAEAVGFDNASLGVTAAENGGTVPYTSLYKALSTTNAATGYTADANIIKTAGVLTYDDLSDMFGLVEGGDYWSEADQLVIAHPSFKSDLRGIKGSDGHPVFEENKSLAGGEYSTLWGAPVAWSLGARTHATATNKPTGNPLMFVGNRDFLVKGNRSNPEYMLATADSGAAFLTDEALMKVRVRRAFAVAHENAWAAIEITSA